MTDFALKTESILPDQEARERASGSLDENLLLEAGAGTGKTRTLVTRTMNLLKEGRASIDEIVAITFTRKATAEMVTRLRDALEKTLREAVPGSTEFLNLKRAVEKFDHHHIYTIHKFSGDLLREMPFEAGVDPAFEIVEDAGEKILIDEEWENWVKRRLSDRESPIYRAYRLGFGGSDLKKMSSYIYQNRDYFENYRAMNITPDADSMAGEITQLAENLREVRQSCNNREDQGYVQIQGILEEADLLRGLLSMGDRLAALSLILNLDPGKKTWGKKENWPDTKEKKKKKELVQSLIEHLEDCKKKVSRWLVDGCVESLFDFNRTLNERKREEGVLTYQDVLLKARNLLRDTPAARVRFIDRYKVLLVDEFQDTDPLQAEIVFYLAREMKSEDRGSIEEWRSLSPEKGKLFFVGDPKQSIYRFRRADVRIFEEVRDLIAGRSDRGGVLNISVNFRSRPGVIEWVNAQFSKIIKKDADSPGSQPDYVPLIPHRKSSPMSSLFLLKPDTQLQSSLVSVSEACKKEAEAAAAFIGEIVGNPDYAFSPTDEEAPRPVRYSDVALLFRKYTHLHYYEEAFSKRGIPFLLEGGRYFYKRPEIRDLLNLLKAVDNPSDGISLTACLKSPLFGLTDEELLRMKLDKIPFNYLKAKEEDHPAAEAYGLLKRLHREVRNLAPVTDLIEEAVENTKLREFFISSFTDERRSANLDKLLNAARSFDYGSSGILRDFINLIDPESDESPEEADAPLSEPGAEAVRMMTFHKSKGLEFPIVILGLMAADNNSVKSDFLLNRDGNRTTLEYKAGLFETSGFANLKAAELAVNESEITRLLYVACTRAREAVVLPAFMKIKKGGEPSPSGYQKLLKATLMAEDDEIADMAEVKTYSQEDLEKGIISQEYPIPDPPGDSSLSPFGEPMEKWANNLKSIIEKASQTDAWTSYTAEKRRLADEEAPFAEAEQTGKRIGVAFHKVMEMVDLSGREELEIPVRSACYSESIPERFDEVQNLVKTTLGSGIISRAINARHHYREMPFSFEFEGKYFEGAIDLVIDDGDGLAIVDFKTDGVREENLKQTIMERGYKRQAQIYKAALEKTTGRPVKEILYYFVRLDRIIPIEI